MSRFKYSSWNSISCHIIFKSLRFPTYLGEGKLQLDSAVFGLWVKGQMKMIGILCVDGTVSYIPHDNNVTYNYDDMIDFRQPSVISV